MAVDPDAPHAGLRPVDDHREGRQAHPRGRDSKKHIRCATILDNLDRCDPDKVELLPEDGWVLEPVPVSFYEGESVFNVLQRVCKQQKIHMEYEDTPIYNSAYIEGIANFYEYDVGELSGWMYRVNGWFPNYGCSRYQLRSGDVIEWVYTAIWAPTSAANPPLETAAALKGRV